jgi:hypothetical protein
MRRGASPADAVRDAVIRMARAYELQPHHQAAFLALGRDGSFAAAALRPGYRTAVRDAQGARTVEPDVVALPDPPAASDARAH